LQKIYSRNFEKIPPKNALPFQTSEGVNSELRKRKPFTCTLTTEFILSDRAIENETMRHRHLINDFSQIIKNGIVNKMTDSEFRRFYKKCNAEQKSMCCELIILWMLVDVICNGKICIETLNRINNL